MGGWAHLKRTDGCEGSEAQTHHRRFFFNLNWEWRVGKTKTERSFFKPSEGESRRIAASLDDKQNALGPRWDLSGVMRSASRDTIALCPMPSLPQYSLSRYVSSRTFYLFPSNHRNIWTGPKNLRVPMAEVRFFLDYLVSTNMVTGQQSTCCADPHPRR